MGDARGFVGVMLMIWAIGMIGGLGIGYIILRKLRGDCQLCHGKRGGVRGNENIVPLAGLAVRVCDYCHARLGNTNAP